MTGARLAVASDCTLACRSLNSDIGRCDPVALLSYAAVSNNDAPHWTNNHVCCWWFVLFDLPVSVGHSGTICSLPIS